jgi:CheY-like chemotaxis protein
VNTPAGGDGRPDLLLVDDVALFRELEAHYLSRVGAVRTAGNAAAARAAIEARRPSVLVLSLDLPDRPGEELLRELRAAPRTESLPVVALTRGSPGEHARAVRAGASDVLTRPLAHSTLVDSVQRFLDASTRLTRGLPRVPVERPVRFWDVERSASGTLRNLSRGGCFVESPEWLPGEGHELHLDFALPGLDETIRSTARLVWRRLLPGPTARGAGFRFLELDGGSARALGRFIEVSRALATGGLAPAGGFA